MMERRTDIPDDLREATQEFLIAGRLYREFLKRNYRDRLGGVIYVDFDSGELVLYSESEQFNPAIRIAAHGADNYREAAGEGT